MANVIIFRGKAATGKTTLSNMLSKRMNISVLRKDSIFDVVSRYVEDNNMNNSITYDVLSNMIQASINNDTDIIVDIGLANTSSWKTFLSKIDFKESRILSFLCDCSDLIIWKNRFNERFLNPTPNQYFKTFEEIIDYYAKSDIALLDKEYFVDSSKDLESLFNYIQNIINA